MTRLPLALLTALLSFAACATSGPDATLATETLRIAHEKARAGTFSGVVLVSRNGRPLIREAFGFAEKTAARPNTVETRFDIASLGKMFTSVAIAQLVERGTLAYDVPIGRYLPGFPNSEIASSVTLHHLLTHTSGIPDLPEDLFNTPRADLRGYLPFLTNAKLEFSPGAKRAYSNSGFVILGLIIEQATRGSYQDYVQKHVFDRAGMSGVLFGPRGRPHGGAMATADDLVRFFEALRNGKLLERATADTITTVRNGASPYGFGELPFVTDRLVGHSGGDSGVSADAYTYWKSGYTIVVLSNLDAPASHDVARAIRNLIEPRFSTKP